MENWKNHSEVRYREGYEEGAWALYHHVQNTLSPAAADHLLRWLEKEVGKCRLTAQQKAAGDKHLEKVLPPWLAPSN